MIEVLREHLQEPEYVHVLLNPLPLYGLAAGIIALVVALFLRSRPARVVALVIVAITAASAWPVFYFGHKGYDRMKSMVDETGERWLDDHMHRAETLIAAYYVLAALSVATLILPRKWPRSDVPLSACTLALALITLGIGGWIGFAGGQIRHKEFRDGPPPERSGGHEHEHGDEHSH